MGSLSELQFGFSREPLPRCPAIALPVTAAFVFAEGYSRTGAPVVFMDHDPGTGRIIEPFMGVPAHIALTDDRSRCWTARAVPRPQPFRATSYR